MIYVFFYLSGKWYGEYSFRDEWNGRTLRPKGIFYDTEWDLYFRVLELIIIDGNYHAVIESYWRFYYSKDEPDPDPYYSWMNLP